jgi:hypothetical protein
MGGEDLATNGGIKVKGRKEKEAKGTKGNRTFRDPSGETSYGIVHDYNYEYVALLLIPIGGSIYNYL